MNRARVVFRSVLGVLGLATLSGFASAASTSQVVLVAGATGGTGKEVVTQAVAKGYSVRVLVRNEARAREVFGDSVQYVVGDVRDTAALDRAVAGATYVVSALGSNTRNDPTNKPEFIDYGAIKALAEAARQHGIKQFVLVSSMGVTDKDNQLNKMFDNILIWKLKGEDALRASGVPYTVVRPGGLRDTPGGQGGIKALQGDPKVRGEIARADVATVCVNALGREAAVGKTFEIIGDPATTAVDWNTFYASLSADGSTANGE